MTLFFIWLFRQRLRQINGGITANAKPSFQNYILWTSQLFILSLSASEHRQSVDLTQSQRRYWSRSIQVMIVKTVLTIICTLIEHVKQSGLNRGPFWPRVSRVNDQTFKYSLEKSLLYSTKNFEFESNLSWTFRRLKTIGKCKCLALVDKLFPNTILTRIEFVAK